MNIFILDLDFEKNAEYHVNRHVVKMITEAAQLLSGAVRVSGLDEGYNLTHRNHPCSIWTRESIENWLWLWNLTDALHEEYRYRYGLHKTHKAFEIASKLTIPKLPNIGLTPFKLAMPNEYKSDDAVYSYRQYYIHEKRHIADWKYREKPYWWE